MNNDYTKFKKGVTVIVDECYRNDEVTQNINTSETAIVITKPSNDEELVGIQYKGGEIDFVPQDILEVKKTLYCINNTIVYILESQNIN
jgi:hypothetical protein